MHDSPVLDSCSPAVLDKPKDYTPESTRGRVSVAILNGGADKDYAICLATALISRGVSLDFIGSDEVGAGVFNNRPEVKFLNFRGSQKQGASFPRKVARILRYYLLLIRYAVTARPKVFHILWNNKFQFFDRTVLMLYYRCLGRKTVFTAHNVNAGKRDQNDSFINRLSLKIQYHLANQIVVHTEKMKTELREEFGVESGRVAVIPFGLYNNLPASPLTTAQAKQDLGLGCDNKTILFFGNIAPYKGLQYLIDALAELISTDKSYRLIIAGTVKNCASYWQQIQERIKLNGLGEYLIQRIQFIPDKDIEMYFKAADVMVLPYTCIFQSGVLFVGYSFGLPVVASDVGSLREDIVEDRTGFLCRPQDPSGLAVAIKKYFSSALFENLAQTRQSIKDYAEEGHSLIKVGELTKKVYLKLLEE